MEKILQIIELYMIVRIIKLKKNKINQFNLLMVVILLPKHKIKKLQIKIQIRVEKVII